MLKIVIVSLAVLTFLIGLYSVTAQETEVPHWKEHKWREHYLQSLKQITETDPDNPIITALYRLNDHLVDKFIAQQTGETREQVYQRLSPFSTSDFYKHAVIMLESYRAGNCESTLTDQCYMLTIMVWALVDKGLIPLGSTYPWSSITDPNYRPEWADWNIPLPSDDVDNPLLTPRPTLAPVPSPRPTLAPVPTTTPVATVAPQWNGFGDPGVVTYSGWKHWSDSTSKFRLYVPTTWAIDGASDAYTVVYNSSDRTARALVYEFENLSTQADLRSVANNYVRLLREDSDVLGTPTITSRQHEVTGWTEYVIRWEKRPVTGDCAVSGSQYKELWVLGERSTSNVGRVLALELSRCKSATQHQTTLNAIESRFQYWR